MYPSWGNFGGQFSQNYGGPGPRKPTGGPTSEQSSGFGGFEAPSGGSLFSSLQEQHLQQMQQLQMMHQKQLQSVLHHSNHASPFGAPAPAGFPGPSWNSEQPGQAGYKQDEPAAPSSVQRQPPPPPPQPNEPQPCPPPPPEPHLLKSPDNNCHQIEATIGHLSKIEDDKSLPLQQQQHLWYKKHLDNLQKLKQEKSKHNQNDGDGSGPPPLPVELVSSAPPLPPSEPTKGKPPPPPPKEEPPAPPLPPEDLKRENVEKTTDTPAAPPDPVEAARLQQLQAAAAQWQQVQQQRANMQYQALMQHHEKLQQILEQYQQLIQQPFNPQSMSVEMQLRHYEKQQQQFTPLFQQWNCSFVLWHEQFQTYQHKDQLQDYELQWKQWQEQMNATNAHIQERVATLTAMVPFASSQYSGGMMGQYGPFPGKDLHMQQQPVRPDMQQSPAAIAPRPQGPRPSVGFGQHLESTAGPPVRGGGPRTQGPPNFQPQSFNNIRAPRGNNPRFDQPQPGFDGPPRLDLPQQRFDGPPRFDQPQQRFNTPHRFNQPQHRFDGPARFDQPRQRFDQPRFGQQARFEQPPRHPAPPHGFEHPVISQQTPKTEEDSVPKQLESVDSKTTGKSPGELLSDKGKTKAEPDSKIKVEDMTDDNLLGSDDFFVQSDPIPQTLQADTKPGDAKKSFALNSTVKPQLTESKPTVTTPAAASTAAEKNPQQKEAILANNNKPPMAPSRPQSSDQVSSMPDLSINTAGIGRGQPQARGRGCGQMGYGEIRGPKNVPPGENMGNSYEHMPPKEDMETSEEHENYSWQDPSYGEYGDAESEMPPEEYWMPEEEYFPPEEEYYDEERIGSQSRGRGGPPMMRRGPSMGSGGPLMARGGPAMGRGGPPFGRGGPPFGQGGPPMGRGGLRMARGGPPMLRGGPPMARGGPPMARGGPHMARGGPHMARGGPPMARGGPPMARGGLLLGGCGGPRPIGRGQPMEGHWEQNDSFEFQEEMDPYWGEWAPPVRGMRPPFPPGRGRPPRGHPGFMHQGRGRPSHPAQGAMNHESLGHEGDVEDPEMAPTRPFMYHEHEPNSHPMHPDGRGRRRIPPTPHEIVNSMEKPLYDEGIEGDIGWQPPHGRGRPGAPHDMMDSGGVRRRPVGRGMARGMWRPGSKPEGFEEGCKEGYFADYGHGEDDYHRRRLKQDYPSEDYRDDPKHRESEWDRDPPSIRDYPPRIPPSEPYRDGPWREENVRDYAHGEPDRGRGELRVREYRAEHPYPPRLSEWERSSRIPPPAERGYPADYEEHRARYGEGREEPPLDRIPPALPVTNLPENTVDSAAAISDTKVLALSQHQHEIILKAAQELKLIREMKEGKTLVPEPQHASADILPEQLPAGLLGLEIPPDVRDVLKGMTASTHTTAESLDSKPIATDYQPPISASSISTLMPKTVDYGHGHEPGATVERISYGERIILRPDPVPMDRGYEKEPLGLRDPYSRDPYYERRPDPYLDRREYGRERELYREKLPPEYERERFERDRYPRERDDRSPLGTSLRPGYRERDRDLRERERSSSHDREEHFGRLGYDRPPYDRIVPERFGHSTSPYVDRRNYPEERGPPPAPPLPPPPQPPPRVEKKPEIKNIDDILKLPGRSSRPERIVIIMRGLPGSGKSHVAKLIRDKEVECGGAPPRVLVLDDYFMTEVEKVEKDPDTGRKVKTKVLEFEYEPEMEDTYRSSMLKTFKKTLDDGFFPFIILDSINDRVKHFEQFWSAAKTKGFEVYVAEITAENQTCAKRNVHGRSLKDIMKMSSSWEPSPRHMMRLDVRSLLQDAAIEEVEMEDFNPDEELKEQKEEEEEGDLGYIPKSKWEMDTSEAKLDKLDGLGGSGKRKREDVGLDDYLQLPDDYATRMSEPGKKRVRWADLEEQKDADRKRAIGFVVGQTDWARITDESGQLAQRALNRTKYF
ncbi:YLP motif-containing protein 1 isoform X3 [Takifugu rubripes]|uniref:YLP motif-containing protein 1 isoform X3 n=1 Tax=Takifugu rubripes TaxID=31033 RepID=UPI0011455214|nr:YLP motif-containing protein 1 isoform X3 [Takifugu rubripes]